MWSKYFGRSKEFSTRANLTTSLITEDEPSTPNMRAIAELEADLQQSEKTLSDLTTNFNALRKSEMELTELKHVLTFADQFLKVCH